MTDLLVRPTLMHALQVMKNADGMSRLMSRLERTTDPDPPRNDPQVHFIGDMSRYAQDQVRREYEARTLPRTYHDAAHVARVWATLLDWQGSPCPASAAFAVYHDLVYYSRPKYTGQNEAESAGALMHESLGRLKLQPSEAVEVALGIVATARHTETQPVEGCRMQLWLDADLAGLADPWDDYEDAGRRVRAEIGPPDGLSEEVAWLTGRAKFLGAMLVRDRIYYQRTELEARARENMGRELSAVRDELEER